MISAVELRAVLGADAGLQARVDSIHAAASARVKRYAPGAPDAVKTEAIIVYGGWLYQATAQSRSVFPSDNGTARQRQSSVSVVRCTRSLVVLARPARGRNGAAVRWPWQRPIVEHRSSYTDAVVTAILQSASGGGLRTALATAALETAATHVRVGAGGVRGLGAVRGDAGAHSRLAGVCGVGLGPARASALSH